jgi:hypothetical protein
MSGFLSKFVCSNVVGAFAAKFTENQGIVLAARLATYSVLSIKDLYDFFEGDIVTVTRQDENGYFVEKKYHHKEFSMVKYLTSVYGLAGCAAFECTTKEILEVLGNTTSGQEIDVFVLLSGLYCLGAAGLELICDAFNLDFKWENYQEINGNDFFIVT